LPTAFIDGSRRRNALALLLVLGGALACLFTLSAPSARAAGKGPVSFLGGAEGTTGGLFTFPLGVAVNESTGDTYVVDILSNRVQEFDASGAFVRAWGMDVVQSGGPGDGNEMQAVMVNAAAGQFTLTFSGETTADLVYNASPAEVQAALNALPAISTGGGSVTVAGGPGNAGGTSPYLVNFNGGPLAGTDVEELTGASGTTPLSAGSGVGADEVTVNTFAEGGSGEGFEICEVADQCKEAEFGTSGGGFINPQGIAVNQETGNVYITTAGNRRIDEFDANGYFLRSFGQNVISSGPHNNGTGFEICTAVDNCAAGASSGLGGAFPNTFSGYPAVVPQGPANAGNLVVADPGARRIQEFTGAGAFVRAIGFDVVSSGPDNTGGLEVCKAGLDVCKASVAGTAPGQFSGGQPTRVAVDSVGFIYTVEAFGNARVQRFSPNGLSASVFAPGILTGNPPSGIPGPSEIAVNAANDHVFVVKAVPGPTECPQQERRIYEFDSAGSQLGVDGVGTLLCPVNGFALRSSTGDLFVSTNEPRPGVYRLNTTTPPEAQMLPVTPSSGTTATFEGEVNPTGLPTGYYFEYSADGVNWSRVPASEVPVGVEDNSFHPVSQNVSRLTGSQEYHVRLVANKHFLLGPAIANTATSLETTFTTPPASPAVTAPTASQVKPTAATLNGRINPQNQTATYHFEYGTQGPCSSNPCQSTLDQTLAAGNSPAAVSQAISGLQAGTTYYFRLVATNGTGTGASTDVTLQTSSGSCPNEAFRIGPSAALADCRAYELVSPPETQGVPPVAVGEANFAQNMVTPDGGNLLFRLKGAALGGTEGTGTSDFYEAIRGSDGWTSRLDSPTAAQAAAVNGRGISADHGYGFFDNTGADFSLQKMLRYPDGTLRLLGDGSLADDPNARGYWISPGGSHVIFTSLLQLEPNAPEEVGFGPAFNILELSSDEPVDAVYERTPTGVKTLSLLPNDQTPPAGTTTYYRGTSQDGSSVVFNVDGTMYVRHNGTTQKIITTPAPEEVTFEGTSADGTKVFYIEGQIEGGKLYEFDVLTGHSNQLSDANDAQVANVSADGSHVYFVSREQLDGSKGTVGGNNLYVWDGTTTFIAELSSSDIVRDTQVSVRHGLLHWPLSFGVPVQQNGHGPGENGARTTPDGKVLVFESKANLTSYDSEGHTEIYRYDTEGGSLQCVSCNPTGDPAVSDALLEGKGVTTFQIDEIPNVTDDGKQVFFMSSDSLVGEDIDGRQDVYQWKEGQINLISYPRSPSADEWLYGMTPDGHDVFFTSNDILTPQDPSAATSIYDARIGGGFPPPPPSTPCVEDNCQGSPSPAAQGSTPGSVTVTGSGNAVQKPCKKGAKRIHGRCVHKKKRRRHKKKHQHHSHKGRANNQRGGKA
jgi:Tol biopolymer transport system component